MSEDTEGRFWLLGESSVTSASAGESTRDLPDGSMTGGV